MYCFDSKYQAQEVGLNKVKLLKNPVGWKVRVWENLGWHLSLIKSNLELHYSPSDNTFTADLSENCYGGDSSFWHESYSNKDPNKVLQHKLKVAKAFIKQCQNIVAKVEE